MFIYQKVIYIIAGEFKLTLLKLYDLIDDDLNKKYRDILRQWTMPIILSLGNKNLGFNELKRKININSTTLSNTLSILEKYNLIERNIIASKPVKVNYSLTEKGNKLYNIIASLADFLIDLK